MLTGDFTPRSDMPPYSWWQRWVIDRFHELYYGRWRKGLQDTTALSWFGYHTLKCPLDLWMYQELLVRIRPHLVIETGTRFGGSALYLASICDLLGAGRLQHELHQAVNEDERQAHPHCDAYARN